MRRFALAACAEHQHRGHVDIRSAFRHQTGGVVHHVERHDGRHELAFTFAGGLGKIGNSQTAANVAGQNYQQDSGGRKVPEPAVARCLHRTCGDP